MLGERAWQFGPNIPPKLVRIRVDVSSVHLPSPAEVCEWLKLRGLTADGYWEVSSDSCLTARVLHSLWRAPSPPTSRERDQGLSCGHTCTHSNTQLFQTNYGHWVCFGLHVVCKGEHLTHCCPLILTSTLPVTPPLPAPNQPTPPPPHLPGWNWKIIWNSLFILFFSTFSSSN